MKHIYTLEFWRDVKGYEGLYQVNNVGQVKSLISNKILKPYKSKDGYLRVYLYKNGKRKLFLIHRLVAEAFLSNPENLLEVDHINGDRADNRVANLQWISKIENNRKKETGWGQPKRVICIETGEIFDSVVAAAESANRRRETMNRHLRGKTQTCAGKHFKYYEGDGINEN
jgi:hypothetical protein